MTIDTNYTAAGLPGIPQMVAVKNDIMDGFFAGHLEKQTARVKSSAIGRQGQQYHETSDGIAAIKKMGLIAYIMERHAKRVREQILASMGLTEEALGKMPPEQRAVIERMIAEETQKRMAAEAMMQKNNDKRPDKTNFEDILMEMGSVSLLKMKTIESAGPLAARQADEER